MADYSGLPQGVQQQIAALQQGGSPAGLITSYLNAPTSSFGNQAAPSYGLSGLPTTSSGKGSLGDYFSTLSSAQASALAQSLGLTPQTNGTYTTNGYKTFDGSGIGGVSLNPISTMPIGTSNLGLDADGNPVTPSAQGYQMSYTPNAAGSTMANLQKHNSTGDFIAGAIPSILTGLVTGGAGLALSPAAAGAVSAGISAGQAADQGGNPLPTIANGLLGYGLGQLGSLTGNPIIDKAIKSGVTGTIANKGNLTSGLASALSSGASGLVNPFINTGNTGLDTLLRGVTNSGISNTIGTALAPSPSTQPGYTLGSGLPSSPTRNYSGLPASVQQAIAQYQGASHG